MGHLATHNYMRIFDDATYHLLARLGYVLRDAQSTQRGWLTSVTRSSIRRNSSRGPGCCRELDCPARQNVAHVRTRLLRTSGMPRNARS